MSYRPLRLSDNEAVKTAANSLKSDKQWVNTICPGKIIRLLMSGRMQSVVVNETYLVAYSVGLPWYSSDKILEEQVVIRIYPGPGVFTEVISALEDLAAKNGCVGVAVGTALANDSAMRRVYERRGFQTECIGLYKPTTKELANG